VCRKAGFTLLGETDIEYPPGSIMRCNNWQVSLTSAKASRQVSDRIRISSDTLAK
jgi:hypothetical protein